MDNRRLCSGSDDHTIRIWDVVTGECVGTLKGHNGSVFALGMLSDGRLCSGGGDNMIKIWDLATYKCIQTLQGHGNYVFKVIEY